MSAPFLLSTTVLGGIAATFLAAFPAIHLDIEAEDRMADPVADGFDVVIRVNPRPEERLVGRCVMRDERWLVAAPDLPCPACPPSGPTPVRAVVRQLPSPGEVWRIHDGSGCRDFAPEPVLRLSSLPMLRDAVVGRAGAALLPPFSRGTRRRGRPARLLGMDRGAADRALGPAHVAAAGEP